jgi:hypothetical protein
MSLTGADPSLGQLLSDLAQKTGLLVRQEVQLARTEMTAQATSAARSAGLVGAGGALAHAGLLAIVTALVVGLGAVIPIWIAALVVGVVVGGAGYALVWRGMRALRAIDPVPRTRETLRDDKAMLQEQMR